MLFLRSAYFFALSLISMFWLNLPLAMATQGKSVAAPLIHSRFGAFNPKIDTLVDLPASQVPPLASNMALKVVQFIGPIQTNWREHLLERNCTIYRYMPDHALIVGCPIRITNDLASLPEVLSAIDLPRLWRFHPSLVNMTAHGADLQPSNNAIDVDVELAEPAEAQFFQWVKDLGGRLIQDVAVLPNQNQRILHLQIDPHALLAVSQHAQVLNIAPHGTPHVLNDMSYGIIQSGVIHQAPLWNNNLRGQGQLVATCDVGVQQNSCFFSGNKIVSYQNITPLVPHDMSHGTHTAGSIAGDQGNNGVYELYDGMAPAAQLYIQDAGTAITDQLGIPGDLSELFLPAYSAGARLHSDSWGDLATAYSIRESTLDAFVMAHPDFLVVVAAGNDGDQSGTINSPAIAKNLIAVGSMGGGNISNVATFSSHGPTLDGRIKPTLVAPGTSIVSADSNSTCGVVVKSGTSQAAALVAGGAAMVRQYFVDGYYPTGLATPSNSMNPSAALLKATILVGTVNMLGQETGGSFPAAGQGFGRIDLHNSLNFPGDTHQLWVEDNTQGLSDQDVFEATLQVQSGDLRVVLSWTDPAAAIGAAQVLVNDLNLEITGPTGTYLGNVLQNGVSVTGGNADHVNVEEMIYVPNAPAGTYIVRVNAANTPVGQAPFAVALVGGINGSSPVQTIVLHSPSKLGVAKTSKHSSGCNSLGSANISLFSAIWLGYKLKTFVVVAKTRKALKSK